jgi:DNA mismatch repair protein MutS2
LLIGIPGRSNAFEIAYRLGLPGELINNARNFVSKDELKIEELLQDIYQNRKQAEREKEEVEKLSEEIKRLKEDYYRQLNKLKNRKEDIIKDAKREALEIVEKAKEEAQKIIDQLRKINKEDIDKNKKIEATRTKLDSKINQLKDSLIEPLIKDADKPADDLKLGDAVFIESLNQKGYVTQEPEGEEVQVQVGIMKINVPVTSLRKIEEDEAEEKKSVSKIAIKKSKTVSLEIDVRGAVLDDALKKVDKYIDDAYLAGLKQVSIIHGKGTGTLRKGIQDFLKNNSLVKSFRDGRYGEGGDGVTVVTLNL